MGEGGRLSCNAGCQRGSAGAAKDGAERYRCIYSSDSRRVRFVRSQEVFLAAL